MLGCSCTQCLLGGKGSTEPRSAGVSSMARRGPSPTLCHRAHAAIWSTNPLPGFSRDIQIAFGANVPWQSWQLLPFRTFCDMRMSRRQRLLAADRSYEPHVRARRTSPTCVKFASKHRLLTHSLDASQCKPRLPGRPTQSLRNAPAAVAC